MAVNSDPLGSGSPALGLKYCRVEIVTTTGQETSKENGRLRQTHVAQYGLNFHCSKFCKRLIFTSTIFVIATDNENLFIMKISRNTVLCQKTKYAHQKDYTCICTG